MCLADATDDVRPAANAPRSTNAPCAHAAPVAGQTAGGARVPWSEMLFGAGAIWRSSRFADMAGTVGTQGAMFGLQALHSIILARLLGPHGRGEYGTAVLYSQLLMYAGLLGTLFSIARRAGLDPAQRAPLANASLRVGALTGGLCCAVVGVLALFALPPEKAYLAPWCLVAGLLLPFEHMRLALLAVDHGSGNFRRYNANRLVGAAAFPLLLGVAWLFGAVTVPVVVGLFVLTAVLSLAALLSAHAELGLRRPAAPPAQVLIREGIPYASAHFAAQLAGRLDTLLVVWLLSFTSQGYYAVAVAASGLMQVVPNALALLSFNAGAKQDFQPPLRRVVAAGLAVLLVQAATALGLALTLRYLLPWVFGDRFLQAIPMALALLPGLAVEGVATVAEGYLRGRGKPLTTLRPRFLGAVALVVFAFLLFPRWQSLSIPIAASIGQTLSGIAILWMALRERHSQDSTG